MDTRSVSQALGGSRIFGCLQVVGVFVLALIGFLGTAYSQSATGTLTGTVTDPQGAAMAGVNVIVHNNDTGLENTVKTNDTGTYTAPLLQPGSYDVTASQAGFATIQNKGVTVQVGATARIDIPMTVASQQSLVTVTTEVPLIETEKTEQSQNVSESLVTNLPISSRRWEQFVLLTPGVAPDGGGGKLSFHGVSSFYNNNSVDGANNNNSYQADARGGNNDGYVYSGDSIREFQVASSNFSAEIGQSAGGSVNAVTKSGSSQFHGDLFYNGRTPSLNAIDPVTRNAAILAGKTPTQTVHQQNQWGGSVGGPLLKDKLFYFFTADFYRKVTPISYTTTAGTPGATSIAGLACPTVAFLSAAQCATAKSFISDANLGTFPRLLWQDVELLKLDYQLTQSNHISAVTNIRDWKEPNGTAFASTNNSGLTTSGTNFTQDRFVITTWNMLIGSNKVNELRYQWGIDNNFNGSLGSLPQVLLSQIFTYGQLSPIPGYNAETRNQVSDNFSFTKGTHTFKAGFDANFIFDHIRISRGAGGQYNYTTAVALNATTSGCPATGTGLIFCDWVFDVYGVADGSKTGKHWTNFVQIDDTRFPKVDPVGTRAGVDDLTDQDYAWYFQDTWKARPNMTVNAGLRYDLQLVPSFDSPNTRTALTSFYTTQVNTDKGGIQPRLGIAWNIAKKTVIRAGGGVYFAKTATATYSASRRTSGLREQQFTCTPTGAGATGACVGLTFPNLLFQQQQTSLAPAFPGSLAPIVSATPSGNLCTDNPLLCTIRGLDPQDVRPRAYMAEAGIEQQLPGNINLSVSYTFTRGVHFPAHYDSNVAKNSLVKGYDILGSATGGPTQLTSFVPFFTTRIDTTSGAILAEHSIATSTYHGMTVSVRKPMSHQIEVLANYTLSLATDSGAYNANAGSGMYLGSDGVLDPYNFRGEFGPSGTDTRNRFVASVIWQPTFAKNFSSGVIRAMLGGWNLATTLTASDGSHYSARLQSTAVQCAVLTSPCPIGFAGLDGGMTGTVLNSNGTPDPGRAAWLQRNSFILPAYHNIDLRLEKDFSIHERFHFALRGEAFNLLNTTITTAVDTTGFNFVAPSATSPVCPLTHTNTCIVPIASFQNPTTTSTASLGARQLQAGVRFSF